MLTDFKKKSYSHKYIINFLFLFYPVSFIIGNFSVNLNTTLIIFFSFFFLKKNFFLITSRLDKLILIFFFYIFIVCLINTINLAYFNNLDIINIKENIYFIITKSIFYLRYLFLYFAIKIIINENKINLKIFFLVTLITTTFISIDILIQFFFNKDIFGITPVHPRKLSGPFGEELIAGSYLQKFFPFAFCYFICFTKLKNLNLTFSIVLLFLIFTAIILSGNRMPLLLSILIIVLTFIFIDKIRKFIVLFFTLFVLIFSYLYFSNQEIKTNYNHFFNDTKKIFSILIDKTNKNSNVPTYYDEFESFYDTWQLNKYFGGGIRSFRIYCPYRKNIDVDERKTCNTHPHNYYLETLAELGLVGILIFVLIFYELFKKSYAYISNLKETKKKYIALTFLILFIIEFFPIKSSGSIFSTWNSTYIFILIGTLQGIMSKKTYLKIQNNSKE